MSPARHIFNSCHGQSPPATGFSGCCSLRPLLPADFGAGHHFVERRGCAGRPQHGPGGGNLGGKVKRDDKANDVLYFKFHVDPISDVASEPYFAGFQLFEGDQERLGVGNALEAWGYSAFNTSETGLSNKVAGEFNLNSAHPEPAHLGLFWPYEDVHHGVERTIVFKVQYVPGGDDLVTVWLDPDLGRGATEKNQPENITTKFKAKATFDQIRLRHNPGPETMLIMMATAGFSATWRLRLRSKISSWCVSGRRGGSLRWLQRACWSGWARPCALWKKKIPASIAARRTGQRAGAGTRAHRPGFAR